MLRSREGEDDVALQLSGVEVRGWVGRVDMLYSVSASSYTGYLILFGGSGIQKSLPNLRLSPAMHNVHITSSAPSRRQYTLQKSRLRPSPDSTHSTAHLASTTSSTTSCLFTSTPPK
jgi:hypothetical protein